MKLVEGAIEGNLFLLPLMAVSLGLGGCSESQARQGADGQGERPPRVKVARVVKKDLHVGLTRPGSVRAMETADLYAKVAGYLACMEVDIGDSVKAGQILAVIDVPEMQPELRRHEAQVELAKAQVKQAEAARKEAEAALAAAEADLKRWEAARREKSAQLAYRETEFARWKGLVEGLPAIEGRRLDEARHRLEAARAGVAMVDAEATTARARVAEAKTRVRKAGTDVEAAAARVNVVEAAHQEVVEQIKYARIKAPFDGVVTERHVHPGAFIRPASTNSSPTPLLTVKNIDDVRVLVDVPMDAVDRFDVGDRAVFSRIEASPNTRIEGRVTRIARALGERSRMMRAEVHFENPTNENGDYRLRPGYYGQLEIMLEQHKRTPTVPASAVFGPDDNRFVWVVNDGVARRRHIQPVYTDGIMVGVDAGLEGGERIIVGGTEEIRDGQPVTAVSAPVKEGGQ